MSDLSKQKCEACSPGAPQATKEEKQSLGANVPDWEIVEVDGEEQLKRTFKLKNFAQAQAFTNRVGDLAEEVDHHPVIVLEYGKVTVHWWSHEIHGLHKNDFIMAARTDEAFNA
ncbi:4a-hydroxytetrahydrobiopterin dehydratase [Marinobacter confluentis]|uniref:Putative pterin-4-alpha-carbinolamine dehydratase n=1 Tax=Marinobacter confluentis TaxID=1697557 RepID=A0A4Z1CJM7_9GAMM|nr:4a-hydroxytetrahydrobiopterin dehydratase [Marinobacter confluentis]TGN41912.1 4a-hydroxytetrahydrobiopterin dehydratase [Marinobacter confluentis]